MTLTMPSVAIPVAMPRATLLPTLNLREPPFRRPRRPRRAPSTVRRHGPPSRPCFPPASVYADQRRVPRGVFSQDQPRINPSPQAHLSLEQDLLDSYVPILIFVLIVLGLVGALVTLSFVLGPTKPHRRKLAPYESGIIPDTPAVRRLSVRFYLTAMLFIIFDVEAVFFYPWAVLLRQLKWFGLIEMLVFIGILLVALAHIWKKGGLDWE